jgi:hypothetical protein
MRRSRYRVGQVSTLEHTVPSPAVYKAATSTKDFLGEKTPKYGTFRGEKKVEIAIFRL